MLCLRGLVWLLRVSGVMVRMLIILVELIQMTISFWIVIMEELIALLLMLGVMVRMLIILVELIQMTISFWIVIMEELIALEEMVELYLIARGFLCLTKL